MAAQAQLTMLSTRMPIKAYDDRELPFLTRSRRLISTTTSCSKLIPPLSDYVWSSSHYYYYYYNNCNMRITKASTTVMSAVSSRIENENENYIESPAPQYDHEDKFDWYAQWYPVMPVCDLDKKKPLAKRVIGLDVVVWFDQTQSEWKVFDDMCPHRLAPLSEGRIDQSGRLQCVYHGWCFNASGQCKLIPQAPPDGPPVHTSKKACVAVYPSTVQNGIVWFWPNSNPEFKDIIHKKKPPFFPELDDPAYSSPLSNRDINYGYETLIENLMDPAHVPYAHYGILKTPAPKVKADREGGRPLNLSVKDMDINGFSTNQDWGSGFFFAPCVYYVFSNPPPAPDNANHDGSLPLTTPPPGNKVYSDQPRVSLIFICIPVSPGKSRVIWSFPRNTKLWLDCIIPKWVFHLNQNLVLDSDLYLLHLQERKVKEFGPTNWHKICFVPTKSDAILSGYRRWLNKYSQGQVDWGSKFNGGTLPPTPPRHELLDRYWTHVVNCSSCNAAYRGLHIAETVLQVMAFGLIGVVGLTKQTMMTTIQRTAIFLVAILFFLVSKWLSHFTYKNFHFHDYNHALK